MINETTTKKLQITPRITIIKTTENIESLIREVGSVEEKIKIKNIPIIDIKLSQVEQEYNKNDISINEQIEKYNSIARKYKKEINIYAREEKYNEIKKLLTSYR